MLQKWLWWTDLLELKSHDILNNPWWDSRGRTGVSSMARPGSRRRAALSDRGRRRLACCSGNGLVVEISNLRNAWSHSRIFTSVSWIRRISRRRHKPKTPKTENKEVRGRRPVLDGLCLSDARRQRMEQNNHRSPMHDALLSRA